MLDVCTTTWIKKPSLTIAEIKWPNIKTHHIFKLAYYYPVGDIDAEFTFFYIC